MRKLPKQSFHHLFYNKSYPKFISNTVISNHKFKIFKHRKLKTNQYIKSNRNKESIKLRAQNRENQIETKIREKNSITD